MTIATGSTYVFDKIDGQDGATGADGAAGADGISSYLYTIFKRSSSVIGVAPTGGSYDFSTNTGTPPTGWSNSVPSGTDPLYASTTTASIQGTTGTDSSLTWTVPNILAQNGTDGTIGADGQRGPVIGFYASMSTGDYNSGNPSQAAMNLAFQTKTGHSAPVENDYGTFYDLANPGSNKITRAYIGGSWQSALEEIDGSLFVSGTIAGSKIVAESISGNEISSSTKIVAATGNNVGVLDGVDSTYRIYAGSSTAANAPFRVAQNGAVTIASDTNTSNSRLVIDDDQIAVYEGTQLKVLIGRLS